MTLTCWCSLCTSTTLRVEVGTLLSSEGTSSYRHRYHCNSNSGIADDRLAIHGFSGADTVASLHAGGKATVIKIAKKETLSLSKVGDVKVDMKSVQAQPLSSYVRHRARYQSRAHP